MNGTLSPPPPPSSPPSPLSHGVLLADRELRRSGNGTGDGVPVPWTGGLLRHDRIQNAIGALSELDVDELSHDQKSGT